MKSCLLALSLILAAGSAVAQKTRGAEEISYCDLIKAPQQFAGKQIRLRAVYKYGFELQRLDSPTCCPDQGPKIWVEISSELEPDSARAYSKFPKGMGLALATFEGMLESGGPYGDGGYRFRFTVNKIIKLERTAKAAAGRDPAWGAEKCGTSDAPQERAISLASQK